MKANVISEQEYKNLLCRIQAYEQWRNGRNAIPVAEIPEGLDVSNDDRAKVEIYEFVNNPPDRYFAYVKVYPDGMHAEITNWTGVVLGNAFVSQPYRCPAFGVPSKRRAIRKFKAINGKTYYGTFFESSGSYCRLKIAKS